MGQMRAWLASVGVNEKTSSRQRAKGDSVQPRSLGKFRDCLFPFPMKQSEISDRIDGSI